MDIISEKCVVATPRSISIAKTFPQPQTSRKMPQKLSSLGPKPKYLQQPHRQLFSLQLPVSLLDIFLSLTYIFQFYLFLQLKTHYYLNLIFLRIILFIENNIFSIS